MIDADCKHKNAIILDRISIRTQTEICAIIKYLSRDTEAVCPLFISDLQSVTPLMHQIWEKFIIYVFPFTIWTTLNFCCGCEFGSLEYIWVLQHIFECVNCIMYAKIVWQRQTRKNFHTKDDDEGQNLIRCATQTRFYNTNNMYI